MGKTMTSENFKQNTEMSYRPCLLEDFLTDQDRRSTSVHLMPKRHLYGSQPKEDYSYRSRKEAQRKLLEKENRGYLGLIRRPILVVPVFDRNIAQIIITDGHHRARYMDRPNVPVRIIPIDFATEIYNRATDSKITIAQFADEIMSAKEVAETSFETMPETKKPIPVYNATCISELRSMFEELPNFTADTTSRITPLEIGVEANLLEDAQRVAEREERRLMFTDIMNI